MIKYLIYWITGIIIIIGFETSRRITGESWSITIGMQYMITMGISTIFGRIGELKESINRINFIEERQDKLNNRVYKELGRLENMVERNTKDIKDVQRSEKQK